MTRPGILSPSFGSKRRRRNQLVARLKRARGYKPPKRKKSLARIRKHPVPVDPKWILKHYGPGPHSGTGTSQDVHGGDGGDRALDDDRDFLALVHFRSDLFQISDRIADHARDYLQPTGLRSLEPVLAPEEGDNPDLDEAIADFTAKWNELRVFVRDDLDISSLPDDLSWPLKKLIISGLLSEKYDTTIDIGGVPPNEVPKFVYRMQELFEAYGIIPGEGVGTYWHPRTIMLHLAIEEHYRAYGEESPLPGPEDWGGMTEGGAGAKGAVIHINTETYDEEGKGGVFILTNDQGEEIAAIRPLVSEGLTGTLTHEYGHLVMHVDDYGFSDWLMRKRDDIMISPGEALGISYYASSGPFEFQAEIFTSHWEEEHARYDDAPEQISDFYNAVKEWSREKWQSESPPPVSYVDISIAKRRSTPLMRTTPAGSALPSQRGSRSRSGSDVRTRSPIPAIAAFSSNPLVRKHYGPGPHKSGTPQSVHGSWARGLSARQRITDVKTNQGFTVHYPSGQPAVTGFAFAVEGHEERISVSEADEEWAREYRRNHLEALSDDDTSWGAWIEDGEVYFDISKVDNDFEEAVQDGKAHNQDAIFDLNTFNTIWLKPKPKGADGYTVAEYRKLLAAAA